MAKKRKIKTGAKAKTGSKSLFKKKSITSLIDTTSAKLTDTYQEFSKTIGTVWPAVLSEASLLKWTEELTKGQASIFDKVLDRTYLETHIGGGNHRLFDGGHDLFSAWERAKDADPDDSLKTEFFGYCSAIWKDVTTAKGLPFATLEKASYDEWADKISNWIPGVSKEYLYDLSSYDVMEVLSAGIGAISLVYAFNDEDQKKLGEMLGSMGIVSILSANPIMGICVISTSAYAYAQKKTPLDKRAIFTGASMSLTTSAIMALLGMPFLIELCIVFVVSKLLRKHIFDNNTLMALVTENIERLKENSVNSLVQFNPLKKSA